MPLELLSQLAGWLPAVPATLMALAGLWAIFALGRPPRRERQDRRAAIGLAVSLGLLGGGGLVVFAMALGAAWGGRPDGWLGLGLGGALCLAIVVSGLAGYAVMARPQIGALAIAGVLAGPLVLGGATALAVQVKGLADGAYSNSLYGPEASADRAREADRLRALLTVTVTDVQPMTFLAPSISRRELVEGLRLTIVVRAAEPMTIGTADGGEPRAWFYPDAAHASGWDVALPIAPPYDLPAGETTFTIEERWPYNRQALIDWLDAPQPGPWTLHFNFYPPSFPMGYGVTVSVPFEVPGR